MTTVNGLPAHVLLVHAIVVLLPLSAMLLVLTAVWAPVRRRLAAPNALLSVAVVVLVPVTTNAGEWLERHVPASAAVRAHAELGDTALPVAIGVAVMAIAVWWRARESAPTTRAAAGRRTFLAPGSSKVTAGIATLAVVAAGIAVYDVYRIGDSGAKASWDGRVTSAPAQVR